jgi:hypothetical protein
VPTPDLPQHPAQHESRDFGVSGRMQRMCGGIKQIWLLKQDEERKWTIEGMLCEMKAQNKNRGADFVHGLYVPHVTSASERGCNAWITLLKEEFRPLSASKSSALCNGVQSVLSGSGAGVLSTPSSDMTNCFWVALSEFASRRVRCNSNLIFLEHS